jgi:hypothetical protein
MISLLGTNGIGMNEWRGIQQEVAGGQVFIVIPSIHVTDSHSHNVIQNFTTSHLSDII